MDELKLVKDASLSDKELEELREKFKVQYAQLKGWDASKLSQDQLNEIYSDKRWKNPGVLHS